MHKPAGLAAPLRYAGSAPFGSCHLQCIANLLAWQQVENAAAALRPTWGFSWTGGPALRGSDRWITAVRALHHIDIAEQRYQHFSLARAGERESVARGYPVAAAVDACYLPSPFQFAEHIAHCVIVVGGGADHVCVIDPMNRPEPTRYGIRAWEQMRSAPCTDGLRTFFLTSGPHRRPSASDLVRFLRDDIRTHASSDRRQGAAFLAFCQSTDTGLPDVSEVAAERLYLAKLARQAVPIAAEIARVADGFLSLARRWYLAHSIGREAGGQQELRARQIRLLAELMDRETKAREEFGAGLAAAAAAVPREA